MKKNNNTKQKYLQIKKKRIKEGKNELKMTAMSEGS